MTRTVSDSIKVDLEEMDFKKVSIVPPSLNITPLLNTERSWHDRGFHREIKRAKLPHHALQAFSIIKHEIHDAKMWVIGDGHMREKLESSSIKDAMFYEQKSN